MHVPQPQPGPHHAPDTPPPIAEVPSSHSFSDSPSDFSAADPPAVPASPYEEPPNFRAPDPPSRNSPSPAEALPEATQTVTLNDIEQKLQQVLSDTE